MNLHKNFRVLETYFQRLGWFGIGLKVYGISVGNTFRNTMASNEAPW